MPTSKRSCRICRKWFEPDPRQGRRQRVCRREACQRERHRRNCVTGRATAKKQARERFLKKRLLVVGDGVAGKDVRVGDAGPRDSVTAKGTVEVREVAKVIQNGSRDSVTAKAKRERHIIPKVIPNRPRDATDGGGPSP